MFRDQIEGLLAFLLLVVVCFWLLAPSFNCFLTFQIDELLEYAPVLSSGAALENGCKYIDDYLEKRTLKDQPVVKDKVKNVR